MEERGNLSDHSLKLKDRRIGTVTGVQDIKSFDDKEILLFTKAGKLLIKGEQLHVKRLNLEKEKLIWREELIISVIFLKVQIIEKNHFSEGYFINR